MVKTSKFSLFFLISITLLITENFGLLSFLRSPAESVTNPVKKVSYRSFLSLARLSSNIWQYPNFARVMEDNMRLKRENQELTVKNQLIAAENEKLKFQLDAPVTENVRAIPALVLGVGGNMDIGVGMNDGVRKDSPVVLGNTLIGKVYSVGAKSSSVMLLSDLNFKVNAITLRGARGTVIGQSGDTVFMSKVLQKDPLFVDDQVFTSGNDGYPPNLIVGKVVYIQSDDVSAYKQAKLVQPFDNHLLSTVFVLSEK